MRSFTPRPLLGRRSTPILACLLLACSDSAGPEVRQPEHHNLPASAQPLLPGQPLPTVLGLGPTALTFRPGAPPLEQRSVSFYARKDETRSVALYFRGPSGRRGSEYARLVVPAGALAKHPDGRPVATGDSVLITITAPDSRQLLLRMEPEGLGFQRILPARLTMSYAEANPDYNGDGVVNAIDAIVELRLAIWRQPTLRDLFAKLVSILDRSNKSVAADLPGFSQYIIAY